MKRLETGYVDDEMVVHPDVREAVELNAVDEGKLDVRRRVRWTRCDGKAISLFNACEGPSSIGTDLETTDYQLSKRYAGGLMRQKRTNRMDHNAVFMSIEDDDGMIKRWILWSMGVGLLQCQ